jgi:DNA repair protein RecO (recombination protein O)
MIIRLQGIVLRNKAYGESDQLLYVFTRERGKVSMIAKGAKKPRSRFGAVTEAFTVADFVCYQHSSTSMPSLSQADIIAHHQHIRADLLLTAYGAYWLELVDHVIVDKEPAPMLYQQLGILLQQLDEGKDPEILTRLLELVVLTSAGYQPVCSHCASCGDEWEIGKEVAFSLSHGGTVCKKCRDFKDILLTPATAYYLRMLQHLSPAQLGKVHIKNDTKQQLETVIGAYLQNQLEVKLKTQAILHSLRKTWESS